MKKMMVRFKIDKRTLLLICFSLNALSVVYSASNKNLTALEEDLSKIDITEDVGHINTADKNKRDLPKVQAAVINIFKPVPVVDTIREEEKYGNTGDKFNRIGRTVVNGVEKMATVVNSVLNFPMEAVKKLSRSATEALNNLGGKLVGLQ